MEERKVNLRHFLSPTSVKGLYTSDGITGHLGITGWEKMADTSLIWHRVKVIVHVEILQQHLILFCNCNQNTLLTPSQHCRHIKTIL